MRTVIKYNLRHDAVRCLYCTVHRAPVPDTVPVYSDVAGVRGDGEQRVLVRVDVGERRDAAPRAPPRSHAQLGRRAPVPDTEKKTLINTKINSSTKRTN